MPRTDLAAVAAVTTNCNALAQPRLPCQSLHYRGVLLTISRLAPSACFGQVAIGLRQLLRIEAGAVEQGLLLARLIFRFAYGVFDCDLIDLHYLRHESLELILKQRRHFLDFEGCSQSLDCPLEILLNICIYLPLEFLSILFVRPLEVAPE